MERELVELFEAAKKAADAASLAGISSSGPEVSRCLDSLKQLKKFPVTYDVLVATQVGKKLRSIAKHPMERIKTVAADLLEIWKKVVIEETAKNKKNGCTNNKSPPKTEGMKAEAIKEEKAQKVSKAETMKVEKFHKGDSTKSIKVEKKETYTDVVMGETTDHGQTVKIDKVFKEEKSSPMMKRPSPAPIAPPKLPSLIKCNVPMRDKYRELLVEALSKVAGEADEDIREQVNACDPIRVAVSVESVMFEKMGLSGGAQKAKYRSIMFNLRDSNNPDLRRKVLLGEVKPERLITMTSEEMASEQRKIENSQIKQKALFECERGGPPKATTDQFKCGRCGQKKCTYYQMQTRSADEPMTTYVTCVNCNNRWKFC